MNHNVLAVRDNYKAHSPQKWYDIGQKLYSERKFNDAYDAFTNAMASDKTTELSFALLNNRAATLEKLDNLQSALKDARRMIQLNKASVQGYLRTGKILQMLGKSDLALQIFQLGLKNTSSSSPDYKKLHSKSQELASATMKGVDLITTLPPELIEMVFSFLSFADVCKCLRVSGDWYRYLRGDPSFWRTIDLTQATKYVPMQAYKSYLLYSRRKLRTALLSKLDIANSNIIEKTVMQAPLLETLELYKSGLLSNSLSKGLSRATQLKNLRLRSGTYITGDTYRRVMMHCPSLETVDFGAVQSHTIPARAFDFEAPNLRSFSISFTESKGEVLSLRLILPVAPNLESLRLVDPSALITIIPVPELEKMDKLSELSIRQMRCYPSRLPASIRTLDLHHTIPFMTPRKPDDATDWSIQPTLPKLSHLRVCEDLGSTAVWLQRDTYTPFDLIEMFLGSSEACGTPLQRLELSIGDIDVAPSFERVRTILSHPRANDISELFLRNVTSLDDEGAAFLAQKFASRKIVRLDVSHTRITGVGIKSIVKSMKGLRHLIIEASVVGPDAVAWARSCGITVTHSTLGW